MKNTTKAEILPENSVNPGNSQDAPAGFKYEELSLSVADMLKNGVHFGHRSARWNPAMRPYIFGVRNGIHIIDLDQTQTMLLKALEFIRSTVSNGGKIIFVGTKPQARSVVEWAAGETGMPFVSKRWLGGTFTNFNELKKRIKYLNSQEEKLKRGEFDRYTKFEQGKLKKEIDSMNEKIGGIKKMENLPNAVFAVDIKQDNLAIREARRIKIPVVAISDSNNDPNLADFPIPGNDDAVASLGYILGIIVKEINSAKKEEPVSKPKEEKPNNS